MKRRIVWSCRPMPYGFHILATAPVSGKSLDINVALDGQLWKEAKSPVALMADLTKQVEKTFDAIDSYIPSGTTRH